MDIEKLRAEIMKIVEGVLEKNDMAKFESEVKAALESAEKTITELTEQVSLLEGKAVEQEVLLEAANTALDEVKADNAEKDKALEEAAAKLAEAVEHATAVDEELGAIKRERLVASRMEELVTLNVARAGDARDSQAEKVANMSDEEFAAYRDDMVALRSEIVAALEAKAKAAIETKTEDDDSSVPPADVKGARETAAVLPNVDGTAVENKWDMFGPALAEYMKSDMASK